MIHNLLLRRYPRLKIFDPYKIRRILYKFFIINCIIFVVESFLNISFLETILEMQEA